MDNTKRYERLLDRYRNGDLDRRNFLGLIGAAGLAYGVQTPFAKFAQAQDVKQVRFDGWGGVVSEAFRKHAFDPYTAETGITVVDGTFAGGDEYLAQVRSSQEGEYNIAHLSGVFDYARYVNFGLTVELNLDNIPNMALVMDALTNAFRRVTPDYLSAVPYDYGTTGLAYNRKYISDEEMKEKGASILIDAAYKGKIGGWSDWRTRVWYGALQTGQDPNNIQDMEAVWDAIRSHRDLALKYWSSGAELMSLLAEEEIYVTEGWSGRIAALQQQGHDIGYYDAPGSFAWQECLHVLKGSPVEACEELLNFMLAPETSIAVAEGQNYPPALDGTKVDLGSKIPTLPAYDPTGTLESLTFANPTYWNGNEAEWSETFSRVQRGY
ncbi:spermidine/putrescine ABC transporter, periplasmic substrate-binding protein [Roseovarius sp. TM1035]|jgi:spermidine/putrescine transport system substrate-binding protein|uniref:Putrescine-binding periplasmic protein SpuD n=1 Tax=Roseovarius mucosus TaxID=215743 RepID=A0A1V0RNV1_9RHOB|nr:MULTISPECIES: extracellular solute-binding protein [Roseovarius]ARE83401.1 putrescine-binding periplasmic protein SpuD [Roseovarius mucosus]AWZ19971.1 ABC transporter, periplasmic spermidine putrescine-binding protein PotD [Roseovarius sp. AK1035]EDM31489.1 spermidine/putrescine ABC transporter, periplasmic substrate-binding protein [Roseovarius sp. TM1035]MBW4972951.1 extracellular solute-binding protein [Roseovarius mucosus]|tara:strand:+ start:173 stop:1315 length:1143 start_codon:yes stop_codon:yes gene_type:complete